MKTFIALATAAGLLAAIALGQPAPAAKKLDGTVHGTPRVVQNQKAEAKQPVPSEILKSYYVTYLEIHIEQDRANEAQRQVQDKMGRFRDSLNALITGAGQKPEEWNLDLKTGTMTRREEVKK